MRRPGGKNLMEGLWVDNWEAKVCAPRPRAVYFPIQPDLTQSICNHNFILDLIEKLWKHLSEYSSENE